MQLQLAVSLQLQAFCHPGGASLAACGVWIASVAQSDGPLRLRLLLLRTGFGPAANGSGLALIMADGVPCDTPPPRRLLHQQVACADRRLRAPLAAP